MEKLNIGEWLAQADVSGSGASRFSLGFTSEQASRRKRA
jgi:hypothetical protein